MSGDNGDLEIRATVDLTDLDSGMSEATATVSESAATMSEAYAELAADTATSMEAMTASAVAGAAAIGESNEAAATRIKAMVAASLAAKAATDGVAVSERAAAEARGEYTILTEAQVAAQAELIAAQDAAMGITEEATIVQQGAALAMEEDTVAVGANAAAHSALNDKLVQGQAVREYSALVDEALSGRYKSMTGTVAVLSNRLGLMSMLFSPMGAAVAGGVAVIGTLIAAFVKGAEESGNFNRALESTNGYIGISEQKFRDMAASMEGGVNTIGKTKDALMEVASTGRYTSEQIQGIATAALNFSEVTGESVKKAVADFESLSEKPLESAVKLNEQYHFLTSATFDQIAAFERLGMTEQAAALAEQAFADNFNDHAAHMNQNLGLLERGWNGLKNAISGAWDALKGIGRDKTLEEQIADVERVIANWKARGATEGSDVIKDLETKLASLQILLKNQQGQQNAKEGDDQSVMDHINDAGGAKAGSAKPEKSNLVEIKTDETSRLMAENNKMVAEETASMATLDQIDEDHQIQALDAQAAALKQRAANGQISRQQELAGLEDLENQKYAVEVASLNQITALYPEDTARYNEMLLKKEALAKAHAQAIARIEEESAAKAKASWSAILQPVVGAVTTSIDGIVRGTESGKQALGNLAMSIVDEFIGAGVKMLANWVATEMAKTDATATGEATRVSLAQTAAITTKVTAVGQADTAITASAAQAAAGSAASVSSIPVVGWAMALEVGAAALAAVLAYKSLASAEGGMWEVGGTQLARIHYKESVIPAAVAEPMRQFFKNGGQGAEGGGGVHFHMTDTNGLRDMLRRNPQLIAEAMGHASRKYGGRG